MTRDGFLDRWSRRKRASGQDEPPPAAAPATGADIPPAPPAEDPLAHLPADADDAQVLEALDLPEPETLKPGDDISAFLRDAVPRRLRNRALRHLWRSDPVFACLDGLNDYDTDFTDAATVVPNLRTAYDALTGMRPDPEPEPAPGAIDTAAAELDPAAAPGEPDESAEDPEARAEHHAAPDTEGPAEGTAAAGTAQAGSGCAEAAAGDTRPPADRPAMTADAAPAPVTPPAVPDPGPKRRRGMHFTFNAS